MSKGDTVTISKTQYQVIAVKPYPNAKSSVCDNILIAKADGTGKTWIADYALKGLVK